MQCFIIPIMYLVNGTVQSYIWPYNKYFGFKAVLMYIIIS
jgi:hypothetical protein